MPSIRSVARQLSSTYRLDTGAEIRGTMFPATEGKIPSYDFTPVRLLLRTSPDSLAAPGRILVDRYGRRLLLAELGAADFLDQRTYKTFRLYEMTTQLAWKRESTVTDAVTGLDRSTGMSDLGSIWAAVEIYGREETDRALRIKEETSRLITGAAVEPNDHLDGRIVRRVNRVLGITIAEIQ